LKEKIFITFFLLSQVFLQGSLAQNNPIKFNLVEGNDGEPLGQINAITQDPNGYMWFSGTQKSCIYRYDGMRMISFKHDSLSENSLGATTTETVYADNAGTIWIGFYDGGLDQYNPATGIFKHYRNNPKDPGSLSGGMVSVIMRDHKGILWVGTQNGLDRLDGKTGKFIHYRNVPGNPASLSCNYVRAIYEDRGGVLWIGTGFEYDITTPNEGGLNRMDSNGKFARFMHDPKNPNSLANNKVRVIFEDSRGIFWIGTAGNDGLHTMDREKGIFTKYPYNPLKPDQLSRPPVNDDFDPVTFVKEDCNGAIWIGTNTSGMNRYDTATRKITHYESSNGYPDKGCFIAYTSRDGVLWLGSYQETPFLYRVDPYVDMIKMIISGPIANCMLEDKQGFLWMGVAGQGLLQYDQNKNLVHQFKYDETDSINLANLSIYTLFQNQSDTLWLNTSSGLILFNKASRQFSRLLYKPKPDSKPEKFLFSHALKTIQDKKNFIWIATSKGLFQYNPSDYSAKNYLNDPNDSNTISASHADAVLEDDQGDIWTGTWIIGGGGVNRMNKNTGRFRHYLKGVPVGNLYEDSENTIWAGTLTGLYRYDPETDRFSPFFEAQSRINTSSVNSIIEDDFKNLWIITESDIVKLNADRTSYFIFGKKYGIRTGSLLYAGTCKTAGGEILIGNNKGVFSFSPKEVNIDSKPPKIIVTNFFINNQPVFSGKESPLVAPIEETGDIHLKYNQNILSFRYAAIDYRAPEANKYYTMLENFDNTWREAAGDNISTFINVPPGKYIFRVECFNIDGIKSEKAISIIISPPWWKTWWAYGFYGLLILIFSIFMNRVLRERAISQERRKAQAKELEQAREIEKAYTELKATQTQLIQSEKMASLGELTAGIAHEIQNPLNFVNNFAEVNKELLEEMKGEIENGNMDDVKGIANNIIVNEEKIMHHGRRADSIVKGMLQHSRISTGQKEPTDLNALVEEYLRLAYYGIRAKDKSFHSKMQTDFDATIGKMNIIPQDMGRVMLNLFNNAFYAVSQKAETQPQGYEPIISVSTKRISDKVEIRVKDNGNGIPKKILEKIFQPFFTTKPTGQGTGLGLSISYDIIKAHRGEIKVETADGEFSEFTILLHPQIK
jgi:signal transduction histidine kinase/ligand-binding sensor domain-containing protein